MASGQVSNFVTGGGGGFLWVFPTGFSDRAYNDVAIVCPVRVCLVSDADSCNAVSGNGYSFLVYSGETNTNRYILISISTQMIIK